MKVSQVIKKKLLIPGDRVLFTEKIYPEQGVDIESLFYGVVTAIDDIHIYIVYDLPRGFHESERRTLQLTWTELIERVRQDKLKILP